MGLSLGEESDLLPAGPENPRGFWENSRLLSFNGEYIFTFLDYDDVAFENNFAERQIRPAVILRKNSQSNRSDRSAAPQAILMSIYRTLKLRGLNPTKTTADALKTYLKTGQLPPLPDDDIAHG